MRTPSQSMRRALADRQVRPQGLLAWHLPVLRLPRAIRRVVSLHGLRLHQALSQRVGSLRWHAHLLNNMSLVGRSHPFDPVAQENESIVGGDERPERDRTILTGSSSSEQYGSEHGSPNRSHRLMLARERHDRSRKMVVKSRHIRVRNPCTPFLRTPTVLAALIARCIML